MTTSSNNFPFEIKDLDPEEADEIHKHYFEGYQNGFIRVGPKGYFFTNGIKVDIKNIYNMPIRPDDTFVVTFPKSVDSTPYFPHVMEAWEQRNHPNLLFLFYEDMLKDLPKAVRQVAEFLGKTMTDEQVTRLCDRLKFDNFKKNPTVHYEVGRDLGWITEKDSTFFRKGKSGDWREHFDEQMAAQAQRWIADNLRGTDLRFPTITSNLASYNK